METQAYNFIYEDGQYMTFDLTDEDYDHVCTCLINPRMDKFILTDAGIIATSGLRFVKPFVGNGTAVPDEHDMDVFLDEKMSDEDDDDGSPV